MSERVIKVLFEGDEIETVLWHGARDSLQDIKDCLIVEDGFPEGIVLQEVVDDFADW